MSPAYRSTEALGQTLANQGIAALPRVPASEAIASWAGRPAHFLRLLFSKMLRPVLSGWNDPHERPRTHARLADPEIIRLAGEFGLKYIGVISEMVFFTATQSDLWLDPERICFLRAHMRQEHFFATPVSVYHLATYFEDGSCVLTWSHVPRTGSTKDLASRTGKGNLRSSLLDHQAFVCQWATERNTRPLAIDQAESILGLVRHYYRQLVPLGMIIPFFGIIALLIFFVVVLTLRMLIERSGH